MSHTITPEEAERFRSEGFLRRAGALDADTVETLRTEWRRLWDGLDPDADPDKVHWRDHGAGGQIADRLDPVAAISDVFRTASESAALKGLAEALLGAPAYLFKDKLITKAPNTAGYGLHQDMPYWRASGLGPEDLVTMVIALDPMTAENGAMEFYAGMHQGYLPSDSSGLDVDPAAVRDRHPEQVTAEAGDVIVFHALAPHQSPANVSDGMRRTYFATYARDSARRQEALERYNASRAAALAVHRRRDEPSADPQA